MFRLALLAVILAIFSATPLKNLHLEEEWEEFKRTYSKHYSEDEELLRRRIWEDNMKFIHKHNQEAEEGEHTFTVGMNEYGDMTSKEFQRVMNSYIMRNASDSQVVFVDSPNRTTNDSVDWRTKGYVTPVKNQEACGSSWAFSAIGSLEGQHFKKSGTLVSLSVQNLIDCSNKQGNHGCEGGLMDASFTYIKANGGIDTEESYPYTAKDESCKFKNAGVGATVTSYVDVKAKSERALQQALSTIGPIAVAMDASRPSLRFYEKGIYSEKDCSSTTLDHGILAVGYGSEDDQDYWIVKNSWGTNWGMKGYLYLARNKNNMCGIATQASYPVV